MADEETFRQTITPREAAARLKVCERTIHNMIRSGDLEGFRVGRVFRLRSDAVDRYIERQIVAMGQEAS